MSTTRWFLYDGDCGFCSACGRFLTRHVRTDATVVAWQFVDLAALGLTTDQCDRAVQWVVLDEAGVREAGAGPAAIAALLRRGGTLAGLVGRLLGTRPMLALAGPVYDFVARHRDRLPGGTPSCALPSTQRNIAGGR